MAKTAHQSRVTEFMLRAKQDCPLRPCIPDQQVRILRAKLILEEAFETIDAMGIDVQIEVTDTFLMEVAALTAEIPNRKIGLSLIGSTVLPGGQKLDINTTFVDRGVGRVLMSEVADGCADLSVVTTGTLIAFGIQDEEILEAVDQNNLEKFGPGHTIRPDGKLIKPPNHKKVRLDPIIERQRTEG